MGYWWLLLVSSRGVSFSFAAANPRVVNRLIAQQEKLDADEEKAEERLMELQTQLSQAVNRLARIRRIRRQIKNKSHKLFERGMQELDKEDGVLPALESHENWVVHDLQALGVPTEPDWTQFGLGDFSELGPLVSTGENLSAGPSNSSGS